MFEVYVITKFVTKLYRKEEHSKFSKINLSYVVVATDER